MLMGLQVQIVSRAIFLLALLINSVNSFAQDQTIDRIINKDIVTPITREIAKFSRQKNNDDECHDLFISIKFIIDSKSMQVDTIIYSKSTPANLQILLTALVKSLNISWERILDNSEKDIAIILPIYFSLDKCPPRKLYDVQIWTTLVDLLFIENQTLYEIILIHPIQSNFSRG
jgi:hypothetical protein